MEREPLPRPGRTPGAASYEWLTGLGNLQVRSVIPSIVRPPNLPPYLPLASRIKLRFISHLESQRAFLPLPLVGTHIYENERMSGERGEMSLPIPSDWERVTGPVC